MQNVTKPQSSSASLSISHHSLHEQGDYIALSPRGSTHWGEREGTGTENTHIEKGCTITKNNNIALKKRDGGRELM